MKKTEVFFLIAVVSFAAVFVSMTAATTGDIFAHRAALGAYAGVAGKARDVDVEKIRRLIREGRLSGREALFYGEPAEFPGPRDAFVEDGEGGMRDEGRKRRGRVR